MASDSTAQVPLWKQIAYPIRDRIVEGLIVSLPFLITFWVIWWIYKTLELNVIDPIAMKVVWKAKQISELPDWFEFYAAPFIAVFIALLFLYLCGTYAHSRARQAFDNFLLRVPLVSQIYDSVKSVIQVLDRPKGEGEPTPQRVVLVSFPHPGVRLPAIVTSTTEDIATGRTLVCVYVPTTPVPTSGYFLMVPEEDVTELNWDVQQTLQAIISGGLTVPSKVTFFGSTLANAAADSNPAPVAPRPE